MLIIIDNYDSFTYNLVEYFRVLGELPVVVRNNQVTLAGLEAMQPTRLVISPGPGAPVDAGISCDAIRSFAGKIPVLGVCLGHQCLAEVFGGRIIRSEEPVHGKTSPVYHDESALFAGLPNPIEVGRYHSLIVERATLPEELHISALTPDGIIMALCHERLTAMGVQFHPESILSESGLGLLKNFLTIRGGTW